MAEMYHPDKVHNLGEEVRKAAEAQMKQINETAMAANEKYGGMSGQMAQAPQPAGLIQDDVTQTGGQNGILA